MAQETFTAPLAVVTTASGKAIAKIRNLRIRESHQLGEVQGLGNLTVQEFPKLRINCSATVDFYNVDFRKSTVPGVNDRDFNSVKEYVQHILMLEGVTIRIKRKVQDGPRNAQGHYSTRLETFATIKNMVLEEDSMDINEGQVSTKSQSFRYPDPILLRP